MRERLLFLLLGIVLGVSATVAAARFAPREAGADCELEDEVRRAVFAVAGLQQAASPEPTSCWDVMYRNAVGELERMDRAVRHAPVEQRSACWHDAQSLRTAIRFARELQLPDLEDRAERVLARFPQP